MTASSVFVCDRRGGICVDPWAAAAKIAGTGMRERTAARYLNACLRTADLDPESEEGRKMTERILGVARSLQWRPAAGYTRSEAEAIGDLSEGELLQRWAEQQPDEATARLEGTLWLERNSTLSPSSPDFEARLGALLQAAARLGWGQVKKAAADGAAGKEGRPMVISSTSQRVDERVRAYMQEHPETAYAEAFVRIVKTAPDVVGGYLPVPEPKAPPLVQREPWSAASVEADRRAKAYSAKHEVDYNTALAAVFTEDPALRRDYLRPPVAVKTHGLIAETEHETLLHSLSEAELLDLAIERKLAAPGLSGAQADSVAQISIYDWLTSTGGRAHGSPEAARERDRLWRLVVRERFKRHGLSEPPGR